METVEFHPLAGAELAVGIRYYTGICEELGLDFQKRVEAAVELIRQNPARFRLRSNSYRRVNLRRFPYFIAFVEREKTLWIVAVAHAHRKPEYWTKRINESVE